MSVSAPDEVESGASPASPPSNHRWWVLATVGIAQLMVVLDATIVNIALPSAQADLGFTDGDRQWIITAYALAFGSLLLLGGRIGDMFGRKVTFLTGAVGFAVASAIGGAAPSFEVLVAARAGQGVFAALLAPAALSLLTTTFTDPAERAKAFSIFGAIAGGGGALGLLLGGVLTEYLDWRWTLYVNLIFVVIAFAGGLLLLQKSKRDTAVKLDMVGTVLVTGGLFSLVYGFANAESHDWDSPLTWGFLLAGVVLVAAFAFWQTRAEHPLLPLRVLLDRNRGASFVALAVVGAGMFGIFLFLTYYLQQVLAFSPVQTGVAFMPMVLGLMISSTVAAAVLLPRIGPKPIVPVGMGISVAALVLLTTLGADSSYLPDVVVPLFIMGLGMGSVMAPAMNLAIAGVDASDAGVASAAVNTLQQVGGSIGTALLTTMFSSAVTGYVADHDPTDPATMLGASLHGYETAYWWSAGFFAVGLVVSLVLYRRGVAQADTSGQPVVHM